MGFLKKYINIGEIQSAIIEPKETYLLIYVMIPQIKAIDSPTKGFKAKIVPTPEATDFPPLNWRNIGLEWPIITNIAAITGNSPIESEFNVKYLAKTTGNAPFKASKSITIKNHFLPKTLLTFVAPVEPEPTVLMSFPVFVFTIK